MPKSYKIIQSDFIVINACNLNPMLSEQILSFSDFKHFSFKPLINPLISLILA